MAEIPALELSCIRQALAGFSFVFYFLIFKKLPLPTYKQLRSLLVLSVLMMVMANGLSTWGLKYIPTGLAALIGALYPLCVVIIEWVFYKKKNVSLLTFTGLFLGIAGVAYVFYENMFSHIDATLIFGLTLSIVAMLSWSLGTVFLSRHETNINPYYGMGWQMIIGSFILFIISSKTQETIPLTQISAKSWLAISYLVIAGSIISFVAFIYTLKKLPAAVSSLYAYVNPIVAIIIASFVLSEKLTFTILLGTLVTLAGVYLVNYSVKRDRKIVITEPEI